MIAVLRRLAFTLRASPAPRQGVPRVDGGAHFASVDRPTMPVPCDDGAFFDEVFR